VSPLIPAASASGGVSVAGVIYLVRHAKAGDRSAWVGDDTIRPLTRPGWAQADALVERFADTAPPRLLSSPYVRCVQTLEPLATRLGTTVEATDTLAEGNPFEPVLELIATLPDGSVLCSHGDLIPATVEALHRRGAELTTAPDWRKASVWVLTRATDGTVTSLAAEPPPA